MIDSPGGKLETQDVHFRNGAALEKAGALVGFHTDDGITDSRLFLRSAGLAVRAGMSREMALRGLTLSGAEMLDMADRVGSLKAGKDADFVVLSGDPLSVYTHVLETWVDGVRVFDRENAKDRLYAVGGYGAGRGRRSRGEDRRRGRGGLAVRPAGTTLLLCLARRVRERGRRRRGARRDRLHDGGRAPQGRRRDRPRRPHRARGPGAPRWPSPPACACSRRRW